MIKVLSALNLFILIYHGYVFARYIGIVPHETIFGIINATLLVGFVFKRKELPEVLKDV